MSLGYIPSTIPEEYNAAWLAEEFRRLSELVSKMGMERAVLYPQAVAPVKLEEGIIANADGANWNPGFGQGPYIYENGRWEPMSGKEFLIEVGKGAVPGHSLVQVNSGLYTATITQQDIWQQGGVKTWLTAAETMDIVSTDTVNDIATGTGARSVRVTGLDTNFAPLVEVVALGAAPVTTVGLFRRINFLEVFTTGTYGGSNLGTITATGSTTATVQAAMVIGQGISAGSHYTVKAGFTAQILRVSLTVDANKTADIHGKFRGNADVIAAPFSPAQYVHHWEGINAVEETFRANPTFAEKSDIWVTGQMNSGTGAINVDYDILLIDNAYL